MEAALIASAIFGGASAAAGIEGQAEGRRQQGQAQDRMNAQLAAENAKQAEAKKKKEIGEQMMGRRARQRALQAGAGGRQSTILTSGLGGDGGGMAGQTIGAGGGKTLLGA